MEMCTKTPDDLGGYVRIYEVAERIRRSAPLRLGFGLSRALRDLPVTAPICGT